MKLVASHVLSLNSTIELCPQLASYFILRQEYHKVAQVVLEFVIHQPQSLK